jgi:hypothetical protein
MSDGSEGTQDEAVPRTQPSRTVGQRRREAEQKLEQHLDEASHKDENDDPADTASSGSEKVDGGDVAAIQEDEQLTPADRVDLIANQAIPEQNDSETQHPDSKP